MKTDKLKHILAGMTVAGLLRLGRHGFCPAIRLRLRLRRLEECREHS